MSPSIAILCGGVGEGAFRRVRPSESASARPGRRRGRPPGFPVPAGTPACADRARRRPAGVAHVAAVLQQCCRRVAADAAAFLLPMLRPMLQPTLRPTLLPTLWPTLQPILLPMLRPTNAAAVLRPMLRPMLLPMLLLMLRCC